MKPAASRLLLLPALLLSLLAGCASAPTPRGTGDLGVVIERSIGQVQVVNTHLENGSGQGTRAG